MAVMGFRDPMSLQQPTDNPLLQKIMGGLLGPPQTYGGLLSPQDQKAAQHQALISLGANLMANSGPSPTRVSLGQALGPALMAAQQTQRQSGQDMLQAMLLKTKLQQPAGKTPSAVQEYEYAKANGFKGSFEEWKRVASAQPQVPADIQSFNDFMSRTPEVQQKWIDFKRNSQPYQVVDVGGGRQLLNKSTGNLAGVTTAEQEADGAARIAGATAGGKTTGEAIAGAQLDLPRLEQNTTQMLQAIKQLKEHKGLPYITGLYSAAPIVPGTPQAGADALAKQIQGKTFLEAFTTLKGGGQITEVEGAKAEAAIARLQRSQNRREYIQALTELEGVLNIGLERARAKAAGGAAPTSGAKRVRVDAEGNVIGN